MGLARLDFGSDVVIFFGSLLIFAIVIAVLMERASPRRQKRRRIDRRGSERSGELID